MALLWLLLLDMIRSLVCLLLLDTDNPLISSNTITLPTPVITPIPPHIIPHHPPPFNLLLIILPTHLPAIIRLHIPHFPPSTQVFRRLGHNAVRISNRVSGKLFTDSMVVVVLDVLLSEVGEGGVRVRVWGCKWELFVCLFIIIISTNIVIILFVHHLKV